MSTDEPTSIADAVDTPRRAGATRQGRGYRMLWRGVPRELGFLLLTLPIVTLGLTVLSGLFFSGVGTVIVYVGFFLLLGALYVARGFGTLELVRLGWAGHGAIPRPRWRRAGAPVGFIRATFGPFADGHYWLYLLHGLVINPIVGIATWTVAFAWVVSGLGGVTYWFWNGFLPFGSQSLVLFRMIFDVLSPRTVIPPSFGAAEIALRLVFGVILLVTLPYITRGLTALHAVIARGLLGAWRSEALEREVSELSASRSAALGAEDASLRRLERDIHDGPQQRLIRLQMDIDTAERRLETGDTSAVAALLMQTRAQAGQTLDELRALSQGFAPPILQDRGLIAAFESLVTRSTVPVRFDNTVDTSVVLPAELERSAYFVAAELLTNVAKHSEASGATLTVAWQCNPGSPPAGTLSLWVSDDGRGGAAVTAGHGLAGLDERLRGLRGSLTVDSPHGGPTIVGAHIPVVGVADEGPIS